MNSRGLAAVAIAVLGVSSCGGSRPQPSACVNESPIRASPLSAISSNDNQRPKANVLSTSSSNGWAAGLLFLKHAPPIRSGDEVKIVWHITGQGPLSLQYFDPSGAERPLTFGPTEHLGSSFDRPGAEWGAGFQFDRKGCWHIRLSRKGTSADAWVAVE
jgi:hypothetical protein